jgi:hypothetical protein
MDLSIVEKYEKLRLQRLNAVKKWNASHKDRVNEYSRKYQAKIYKEKKEKSVASVKHYNDPEKYKEYQKGYRITKRLRQMPFFGEEILF